MVVRIVVVAAAGDELLGPRGPCGCGDVRRPEAQRRHNDRDRRGLKVLFDRQLICLSLGESLVGRHGWDGYASAATTS